MGRLAERTSTAGSIRDQSPMAVESERLSVYSETARWTNGLRLTGDVLLADPGDENR